MTVLHYLQLPFAQHALIAATLIAIISGLIGPFVVARDMAFAVHGSAELAFTGAAAGEPGWLAHLQLSVAHDLAGGGGSVALWAAFLSFAVGAGPVLFRRSGIFLIVGVAMALDFWVLGQAFGQIFTGMATDPNTGPLLVLLALAVYPVGARAETPALTDQGSPGYSRISFRNS